MQTSGDYGPWPSSRTTSVPSPYAISSSTCSSAPNVGQSERLVSSVAGACLAAVGLSSRRKGSLILAGLGGMLLYRGMTGRCQLYGMLGVNTARRAPATAVPSQRGYKVEKSVTVNAPAAELYGFWREVENLPKVMSHVKRVDVLDRDRSHWVAEGALGKTVEWDAEIFNDAENEFIAWRSLPGGDVDTAGSVHFRPLGEDHGTVVTVTMKYDPPAGKVGAWLAALTGSGLERKLEEDLQRFKQAMEGGHASPSGHASGLEPAAGQS
ncbi:MAG: cyclase [Planctomycetota bacterium]|nr:MAG: cyclase [Planctomycetota bacterium]